MRIEEGNEDDSEQGQDEYEDALSSMTTMSAIICHCRQLLPFHILPKDFEMQCSVLFRTVYSRSCMGFNEKTKLIEVQVCYVILKINTHTYTYSVKSFIIDH